jgi:hypothetical protein
MFSSMEVYMPSDSLPDLSPEQEFAHKIAARELAKYCEEFSRWRIRKRGRAASEKSQRVQGMLISPPIEKPDPLAPRSSA